jgi:hypothetical protein
MHVFYLHGFASSAQSAKATYFRERFIAYDVELRSPDFNGPDFSTLTMTRMLDQMQGEMRTLPPGPVTLIGSSLGAVVAIYTAARMTDRVQRLVLLAPAVMFPADAHRVLGHGAVERWKTSGTLQVFHYASGAMRDLKYEFYEDGLRYDVTSIATPQPTLIFQGLRDEAVDCRDVERFAATRPQTTLVLLDDTHNLMASLPRIWDDMVGFLELR